jgi:hypothetical protein
MAPPIKVIFVGACANGVYQALFSTHTIKNWKRAPGDEARHRVAFTTTFNLQEMTGPKWSVAQRLADDC